MGSTVVKKDRYTIEILDVALDVIEFLINREGEGVGASFIARELDLNRSRTYRILKTLERRGYIDSDPLTQEYRLGHRFLDIGDRLRGRLDLVRLSEPVMLDLASVTGDAVYLMVRYGNFALLLHGHLGGLGLQVQEPIGHQYPLYVAAAPKVLLAYADDADREKLIRDMEFVSYTDNTITNREDLRRVIKEIRIQGYSTDEEEYLPGAWAVGAPIRDQDGGTVAAISIATPLTRLNDRRRSDLIDAVIVSANRISAILGWRLDVPST
jgi:DNA-binding IclR family transcriptional regulator